MKRGWVVGGVLALVVAGCGEATGPALETSPAQRPTAVPAADGPVTTNQAVIVSDDGSGPYLCYSPITFGGPQECSDASVTNWDWEAAGDFSDEDSSRWGTYVLTGTFDGETFDVAEVSPPSMEPEPFDFTIPCREPEGGWRVLDPTRSTQEDLGMLTNAAETLDGFAMVAVSTPEGEPGPRDPVQTVVVVYVASDPVAAEAEMRKSWGGMLCVAEVERSSEDLERIQADFMDVPGVVQAGGNAHNQMQVTVFHDDGNLQRWADEKYGEGVVLVISILQPVT